MFFLLHIRKISKLCFSHAGFKNITNTNVKEENKERKWEKMNEDCQITIMALGRVLYTLLQADKCLTAEL